MCARLAVGDDLVDLVVLAEAKERDARFVRRVLAPEEQQLLGRAADPGGLLWLLWAAKEAAYKVGLKRAPELVFAHARFVVRPLVDAFDRIAPRGSGSVTHERFTARFRWQRTGDYLHVVAADGDEDVLDGVLARVRRLAGDSPPRHAQSREARALALALLAEQGLAGCAIAGPGAAPSPSPPVVTRAGRTLDDWDLSLSHDGCFVSAALLHHGHPPSLEPMRRASGGPRS